MNRRGFLISLLSIPWWPKAFAVAAPAKTAVVGEIAISCPQITGTWGAMPLTLADGTTMKIEDLRAGKSYSFNADGVVRLEPDDDEIRQTQRREFIARLEAGRMAAGH